jgi:L-ascorbate metabolism protein UlaG (beta-lactamase superfamily)
MIIFLSILLLVYISIILYLKLPVFGKVPDKEEQEKFSKFSNFKNGVFLNIHKTEMMVDRKELKKVMFTFFFGKKPNLKPTHNIPTCKSDLLQIPLNEDVLVWFGHSSYFMQLNGKRFLIDPVFNTYASPFPKINQSFKGTNIFSVSDMPEIDYLLITHDHYDHLDYKTVKALKSKTKKVVCGLGVGSHFRHWGFDPTLIIEKNWNETFFVDELLSIHTTPARHFSGRSTKRNNTLWLSFLVQTPTFKIFFGGDGGYDTHFKEIGERFGAIDMAILENGQYNLAWRNIHSLPDEVLQEAKDLNAKRVLPGHSAKYALSIHPWDEPLNRITELNENVQIPLVTPMIGEIVYLRDEQQQFKEWWRSL